MDITVHDPAVSAAFVAALLSETAVPDPGADPTVVAASDWFPARGVPRSPAR